MIAGILGGTFDPPHLGHLGMVRRALESGQVDEVWVVPCVSHRFGKAPEAFGHRLAMCRLLFQGMACVSVTDIESRLNRPGHTLDLLLLLGRLNPGVFFRLIVGSDIYHERDKWHCYDEVARLAPPLYIARRGTPPIPEPTLDAPIQVSSSVIREALGRGERPAELTPERILDYIRFHGLYGEKSVTCRKSR